MHVSEDEATRATTQRPGQVQTRSTPAPMPAGLACILLAARGRSTNLCWPSSTFSPDRRRACIMLMKSLQSLSHPRELTTRSCTHGALDRRSFLDF